MSFATLRDFSRHHFLRAHRVTGAYKKAKEEKSGDSNRVTLITIIDESSFEYIVKCEKFCDLMVSTRKL